MRQADLVVATGSQANVRAAYASGTPAFGVGAGNVAAIIDETADLDTAAEMIVRSKAFDNATSCSSENSVVLIDAIYEPAMEALKSHGAVCCRPWQGPAETSDVARRQTIGACHWSVGRRDC